MTGVKGAVGDFVVGVLVVAAIYLLVRPGSRAGVAVWQFSEATQMLVHLVTGPM